MADDDLIAKLLQKIDARIAANKLRLKNPYVKDLIEVLRPHRSGLSRQLVLQALEKKRKQNDLPIPKTFKQSVQSTYNRYCTDSLVFMKRKAPESEGLFYSPEGKGSGIWAVYTDRATAWLKAKLDEDD